MYIFVTEPFISVNETVLCYCVPESKIPNAGNLNFIS